MLLKRLFAWWPSHRKSRQSQPRRRTLLDLEALESRLTPSQFTFTVDRITDAGASQAGVGSGSSGDLRYCIAQANATHGNASDTDLIVFNPSVFGSAKTIDLSATLKTLTISDLHNLTIQGPASTVTINGNNSFGLFSIGSSSNVTFDHVALTHGNSDVFGGAIDNQGQVTLTACTLANDQALYGGGLVNDGSGSKATLTACTFSNDSAQYAGGILNEGTLTLTNCTLYKNSAQYQGGGIYGYGGSGPMTLTNCTLDMNSAGNQGGGIINNTTLNLTNTLIALNTATAGPDIYNNGTIAVASHNLIGIGDAGSNISPYLVNGDHGNQVGTTGSPIDPKLGPLANNGGPTQTVALLAGSPAIGAGDASVLGPPDNLTTDQRGLPRSNGGKVDIGAFEVQPLPPPVQHGRYFGQP